MALFAVIDAMTLKKATSLFLAGFIFLPFLSTSQLQATEHAPEQEQLFGKWGNESQCSRSLITPKGTKHFAPFEISTSWLGHGDVWCRLTWISADPNENGMVAFAHGLCGEDVNRDYRIKFNLVGEKLDIIWNTFHKNGPLTRCSL